MSEIPAPAASAAGGPLLVLSAAALWGTTGTAASFAPAGTSGVALGAATMGIGGLLTLLLAGRSAFTVARGGRAAAVRVLLGGLAVAVYPLAFYTAMDRAGVAVGTVVTIGSSPVFAALLERRLDGTRLTRRWAAATACAAVGCAVLVLTGEGHQGHGGGAAHVPAGIALGLLGGASYAAYTCLGSGLMRRGHSSRATMGAVFGLGSLLLLPVLAWTGGPLLTGPDGPVVAGYLALVPMCLAYVLFGAGLARTTPSTATTLTLLESVVAALLGVVVVGERLGPWAWSGVALVLAGLLLITVRGPRRVRGPVRGRRRAGEQG